MAGTVEKKLADLGIVLPTPAAPVANYVPFVRTGNFMVVSGQLCFDAEGKIVAKGQLGGFKTAFESIKPKDCVVVGMYPRYKDEVRENADRVRRMLTAAA